MILLGEDRGMVLRSRFVFCRRDHLKSESITTVQPLAPKRRRGRKSKTQGMENSVRSYNDGPEFPTTPLLQEAEGLYRTYYSLSAASTIHWLRPDEERIEQFRKTRREVKRQAEIRVPSSVMFGNPDMDSEQIVYRAGHEIKASLARSQNQALEVALQCWALLQVRRMPHLDIARRVFRPWVEQLRVWAKTPIDPQRIMIPPRPEEFIPDEYRLGGEPQPAVHTPRTDRGIVSLPLVGAQQLRFSQPPDLRRPIVHGLLRAGETLSLVGPPGSGKTWLAIDLALSVATGQNWLQTFVMGAGPVLYINSDLHRETIVDRIRQVADARDIFRCTLHERLCVEALRGRKTEEFQLESYLDALEPYQFQLIVIDSLEGLLWRDSKSTREVLQNLERHAERLCCSFAVVQSCSGTSLSDGHLASEDVESLAGVVDTHLETQPQPEPGCVRLDASARGWPPVPPRTLRWKYPVWEPDQFAESSLTSAS